MTLLARKKGFLPSLGSDLFDTDRSTIGLPDANIIENDTDYRIDLAAPGHEKKDFKVELDNNILTISAEKKEESSEETSNYTRREFYYDSLSRSFTLPENSIPDKIDAKYENGILRLSIPKKEVSSTSKRKEIKIS